MAETDLIVQQRDRSFIGWTQKQTWKTNSKFI